MNINLENLDYGTYYFVNNFNNEFVEIFNEEGYYYTTVTHYTVGDSGLVKRKVEYLDHYKNIHLKGFHESNADVFHYIDSAYYSQNIRL